jgi:hypothetical protein
MNGSHGLAQQVDPIDLVACECILKFMKKILNKIDFELRALVKAVVIAIIPVIAMSVFVYGEYTGFVVVFILLMLLVLIPVSAILLAFSENKYFRILVLISNLLSLIYIVSPIIFKLNYIHYTNVVNVFILFVGFIISAILYCYFKYNKMKL